MFRHNIQIAYRSLVKHKLTSLINLFGLTIGLTCCLAIIAHSLNELSYDSYHKKADNIYRIVPDWKWAGGELNVATTSGPMAGLLKENFPEVENTARIFAEGTEYVKSGQNTIELSPIFSESNFFEIFDHQFLYGNPKTALNEPNSMILAESAAKRVFGSASKAYGKTLEYINRPPQKVTGIIKDVPENSHFIFNAIGKADYTNEFQNFNLYTYVVLKAETDIPRLELKIKKLIGKQLNDDKSDYRLVFQPLTSIHLNSHLQGDFSPGGNKQYLHIFWIVGAVILLLACINYINLATAQSTRRAKEVGVRKVMGSGRRQLIIQFFSESFVLVITATILSVLLLQLTSPILSLIGSKPASLWSFGWQKVIFLLLGITFIVGTISGLYPAVYLSKFSPVKVLKGVLGKNPSQSYFRKILVVVQFTISIALIAFTLITRQQLNYVLNKDLGFNKDQVLGLRIPQKLRIENLSAFRNFLSTYPGIISTTATTNQLGDHEKIGGGGFFFEANGQKPGHTSMSKRLGIGPDYFKMMEITLKAGRNFSPSIPSDSSQSMIVNETLVKQHGWKNPIGKRIWYFIDNAGNTKEAKVIGVVKDFHVGSLHKAIEPLLFFLAPDKESDNLYIKIKPENTSESLAFIQKTYREFDNYNPYETYFLDQNFANQYQNDNQKRHTFQLFASLAVLIACLGLFGLTSFTIEQRTKEIGIRKVLGATVKNVLVLVTKDFVWLIVIAFVIATPIAFWGINKWLQDFAYKIEIQWWTFALAGTLAFFVAIFTVSVQAIKAASANPVKSLRSE